MSTAAAAPEAGASNADAPPAKSKLKLILIIAGALLLAGGGAGGFFWWKAGSATRAAEPKKAPARTPSVFVPLDPPFVVNFTTADSVRFLQVEVRLAAKDAETAELLKQNDPIVRNDLLMLFGNQDLAQLNLRNGKEHLRALALQAVRNVVRNVGGEPEKVDNVYFTSFVMQ